MLYICIIPTWYISTSGSYITCTYTDNLYFSLIYCSNFLMVWNRVSYIKQILLVFNPLEISSYNASVSFECDDTSTFSHCLYETTDVKLLGGKNFLPSIHFLHMLWQQSLFGVESHLPIFFIVDAHSRQPKK